MTTPLDIEKAEKRLEAEQNRLVRLWTRIPPGDQARAVERAWKQLWETRRTLKEALK